MTGPGRPVRDGKPGTTLQTVERALSVLEFVAAQRRPPTIKEVAAGLHLNLTTTYHLFNTLEYRGYLLRDADGTLRVGPQTAALHQAVVARGGHQSVLAPLIADLAAQVEETVYLTSWTAGAVVIQQVVEATHALQVSGLYVGYRGREVQRASGKAVLAHLGDEESVAAVLERNLADTDLRLASRIRAGLAEELARIRHDGYALDEQTYTPGVVCIAAPYFDAARRVSGSVAVSVPAVRFPHQRPDLISAVIETADGCSRALGLGLVR